MPGQNVRPPIFELLESFTALVALPTRKTTANGNVGGTSIIDAGLIGAGVNSFFTMLLIIEPGSPFLVDSSDITAFNNATGEITFSSAYKGGQVLAGTAYKICPFRFVTAEVAALTAMVGYEGATSLADKLTLARSAYLDNINNADLANIIRDIAQDNGTFSYDETNVAEQTAFTLTVTARAKIGGVWLDMVNVTQDTTIRLSHQIDGSNYRTFYSVAWLATDDPGVLFGPFTAYRNIRASLQCGGGGAGSVNVPFVVV